MRNGARQSCRLFALHFSFLIGVLIEMDPSWYENSGICICSDGEFRTRWVPSTSGPLQRSVVLSKCKILLLHCVSPRLNFFRWIITFGWDRQFLLLAHLLLGRQWPGGFGSSHRRKTSPLGSPLMTAAPFPKKMWLVISTTKEIKVKDESYSSGGRLSGEKSSRLWCRPDNRLSIRCTVNTASITLVLICSSETSPQSSAQRLSASGLFYEDWFRVICQRIATL